MDLKQIGWNGVTGLIWLRKREGEQLFDQGNEQ
jgi:hypothetical protein